jgi:hypothetical protein
MGIAQFTEITLTNKSSQPISIDNVHLASGKIYPEGKKNGTEITPGSVNGTQIPAKKNYVFRTCGRSDAAVGTEGSFDIMAGGHLVRTVYWCSPWGTSANLLTATGDSEDWMADINPAGNPGTGAGPLGMVGISVAHLG